MEDGGAAHKIKTDKRYYYYRCDKCRDNIKESDIEKSIIDLLNDILEYDSLVNEYFLPILKNKVENPKERLYREIKDLEGKKERVRKAYINESFTLKEYDEEVKIINSGINELKRQLLENEQANDMNFTVEDILLKRDLKFLNSIKFPTLYEGIIKEWNDLDREKKYQIIMNYIEDIDLRYTIGKGYEVNSVNFRKAFFKDFNKLFSNGYIDFNKNYINHDNRTRIRISNTLTNEQIEKYITKLKRKYNIIYNVGKLYNPVGKIDIGDKPVENEILRVFPIENKITDKEVDLGVVSFDRTKIEDNDFFDYIRKLPTIEEVLELYLQTTSEKYTIKTIK